MCRVSEGGVESSIAVVGKYIDLPPGGQGSPQWGPEHYERFNRILEHIMDCLGPEGMTMSDADLLLLYQRGLEHFAHMPMPSELPPPPRERTHISPALGGLTVRTAVALS